MFFLKKEIQIYFFHFFHLDKVEQFSHFKCFRFQIREKKHKMHINLKKICRKWKHNEPIIKIPGNIVTMECVFL